MNKSHPFGQLGLPRQAAPFLEPSYFHFVAYFYRAQHRSKVSQQYYYRVPRNIVVCIVLVPYLIKYPLSYKGLERKLGNQQTKQPKLIISFWPFNNCSATAKLKNLISTWQLFTFHCVKTTAVATLKVCCDLWHILKVFCACTLSHYVEKNITCPVADLGEEERALF